MKQRYNYLDLFYIFIWRDFTVKYKQAVLGAAWAVLQPFCFMLLFTFIFTYALPLKVSVFPTAVFYYAGLLPWLFFANSITYSIQCFTGNHHFLKKVYFPRIILPLAGIFTATVDFAIASILYIGLLIFYKITVSVAVLWFIPLFILLFLFTLSLALILSILNVYYRDVALVSSFVLQVLFFASPVLYSMDRVSMHLKQWFYLNPMVFIIENMRRAVLEKTAVNWQHYLLMLLIVLLGLAIVYKVFKFLERRLTDVM